MACSNNILISPANAYWKIESNSTYDYAGITAVSLDGKYYTFSSPTTDYYVWHNLDAGSTDPAPGGTGIEVAVTTGDADTVMAAAAQVAIDAELDFNASVVGTVVDVKAVAVGQVTDPVDGDSGVVVSLCRRGKNVDLGLIEGDSELPLEPQIFDVTSQQTGVTPSAALVQGFTAEPSLVLQETTVSQLDQFYSIYGGTYTPVAGTEITGVGTGTVGKNLLVDAARLEFAPVNAISAELSYSVAYALTVPVPSSLVFSGENPRTLSVAFKAYVDSSLDSRNNFLVIGNAFQSGI